MKHEYYDQFITVMTYVKNFNQHMVGLFIETRLLIEQQNQEFEQVQQADLANQMAKTAINGDESDGV